MRVIGRALVLLVAVDCASSTSTSPASHDELLASSTVTASASSLIADGASTAIVTVALRESSEVPFTRSAGTIVLTASTGSLSAVVDLRDALIP